MSRITINTNPASLNAQRRLGESTRSLERSFQALSSGLRINRASDDSAGLAIASSLATDSRVYAQGIRNFNDGLSLLNVAEGALREASGIIIRMRELATQSANGTLANSQRQALNEEAEALVDEYNRIVQSTKFNGLKLIDKSLENLVLQGGYGSDGQISVSLGDMLARSVASGTFTSSGSFSFSDYDTQQIADINGDGVLDRLGMDATAGTLNVEFGVGDGTFATAIQFAAGTTPGEFEIRDINGDAAKDIVFYDAAATGIRIMLGNADGSFRAASTAMASVSPQDLFVLDFNGDGKQDIFVGPNSGPASTLLFGNGDGSFRAPTTLLIPNLNDADDSAAFSDMNNDGVLDLLLSASDILYVHAGKGDGTFHSAQTIGEGTILGGVGAYEEIETFNFRSIADFDNDGNLDVVTANPDLDAVIVYFGNGDGSFSTASTVYTPAVGAVIPTVVDFNGDGKSDIVFGVDTGSESFTSVIYGNGDGTFRASGVSVAGTTSGAVQYSLSLDMNGDGAQDIISLNLSDYHTTIFVSAPEEVTTLPQIQLGSRQAALESMEVLDSALTRINSELGAIGSVQSRLAVAINNLDQANENVLTSRSRIVDVDVAEESARLVRNQILQQAGVAILGQANQSPALALQLLDIG